MTDNIWFVSNIPKTISFAKWLMVSVCSLYDSILFGKLCVGVDYDYQPNEARAHFY